MHFDGKRPASLNPMKKLTGLVLLVVACFVNLPTAAATPLRLNYDITDLGGGLFDYEFTLTLDGKPYPLKK